MGTVDEISEAIGSLRAQMVALSAQVERSFLVSSSTHEVVHELKSTVSKMGADLETMKPVVEKVKKWEQRVIAVAAMGSVIGSLFWERLFSTIKGLFV